VEGKEERELKGSEVKWDKIGGFVYSLA